MRESNEPIRAKKRTDPPSKDQTANVTFCTRCALACLRRGRIFIRPAKFDYERAPRSEMCTCSPAIHEDDDAGPRRAVSPHTEISLIMDRGRRSKPGPATRDM